MQNATAFRISPLLAGVLTAMASTALIAQANAAAANQPAGGNEKGVNTSKTVEQTVAVNELIRDTKEKVLNQDTQGIVTTNDPAQPVNPDHGKYTDEYVKNYFQNTGVLPGTPLMAMPQKFRRSAGRFGEFRQRSSGAGWHAGLDMSVGPGGTSLRAPAEGTIVKAGWEGAAGNVVTVRRKNGDKYQFFHLAHSLSKSHPSGSPVTFGMPLGTVGNTGGNYAVHLHMEYIIPPEQKTRWRNMWLSSATKSGSSRFSLQKSTGISASGSGLKTDPTPYLAEDLPVKPDNYSPWLGTTIRQQFNALYNTKLPLGPGARSNLRQLPALPVYTDGVAWTPEELAAARASLIKGAEHADWSGYTGAFGAGGMSYQALASFISSTDGLQFGSLPQPETPASIETMSARQIIDQLADQRYGNEEWQKAMLKLSSKGLLTEFTMMKAAENYLSQQNQALRDRVEMLMAGVTQSRLFEYNKKIEALQVEAEAVAVPGILDIELENLGYEPGFGGPMVDLGNLPGDLLGLIDVLKEAISHGEGKYNSYNTGTYGDCKLRSFVSDSEARNSGTPLVTTMTAAQIYNSAYKVSNCNITRKFASGKYQVVYYTLGGKGGLGTGGFLKAFPEYASRVMTPETQEEMARYLMIQKRPALGAFITKGVGSVEQAQYEMAKEWASIGTPAGLPIKGGKIISDGYTSYHHGKNNKANVQSTKMTEAILHKIKQWHDANPGKAAAVIAGKEPDVSINKPKEEAPKTDGTATGGEAPKAPEGGNPDNAFNKP